MSAAPAPCESTSTHPNPLHLATVDGERVAPQPFDLYIATASAAKPTDKWQTWSVADYQWLDFVAQMMRPPRVIHDKALVPGYTACVFWATVASTRKCRPSPC